MRYALLLLAASGLWVHGRGVARGRTESYARQLAKTALVDDLRAECVRLGGDTIEDIGYGTMSCSLDELIWTCTIVGSAKCYEGAPPPDAD